jgi:flagellar operon protein
MTSIRGPAPLRIAPADPRSRPAGPQAPGAGEFARALDQALATPAPVRFSAHAAERIRARGIQLSQGDLESLGRAVDLAAAKGGRESIVLSGSLACVVHVPSRTVVTALSGDQMKGSVFTHIDSAVVL